MHDALKPFAYHGVEFDETESTQARGFCPFCWHDPPHKLYVNKDTQLWDCKHCGAKGNLHGFLEQIVETYLAETTNDHYKELAEDRYGIPWQRFKKAGAAYDGHTLADPRWLFPVRNRRGTVVNIIVYQYGRPPQNTAGLGLHMLGLDTLRGAGDIHVCEGLWDWLAWSDVASKVHNKTNVLGVTGCQIFKEDWRQHFNTRNVAFLYDHQNQAYEGMESAAFKLKGIANRIGLIRWPSATADDWDIRDEVNAIEQNPETDDWRQEVWDGITAAIDTPSQHRTNTEIRVETEDLPKRTRFTQIVTDFRKNYHLDDNMRDGLAICFATTLSIQLPGDPLWLFLVGPPGSGKTLMLESFMKSPYAIYKSSLTPKSLISGFRSEEGDPSLIPQLAGKVLFLKDYTEIMGMGRDQQEEMYAILRGAFDGHCEKTFGNGLTRRYDDCHFAMVAGVTDAIHQDNRAALGERFLKFQLVHGEHYDPTEHIRRAVMGMKNAAETETFIRNVTASFSNKHITPETVPYPDTALVDQVIGLSSVVAMLRAQVARVGRDEVAYRPVPEVGSRLSKQLIKLGQCLAVVFGSDTINKRCVKLIQRVAFDTAIGWNLDIFQDILRHHPKPVYTEPMVHRLQIPPTTLRRRIDDMLVLRTIERGRKEDRRGPGQPAFGYKLTDEMAGLCRMAKLL